MLCRVHAVAQKESGATSGQEGQSVCMGQCHGFDGGTDGPLPQGLRSVLNGAAVALASVPVTGGLSAVATTGKAIQLTVQAQTATRALAAAGQARGAQALATANVLYLETATAVIGLAPGLANPQFQQGVLEFMEGYFVPGPPPPTPGGVLGTAVGSILP